jgi:acetylornithine/succinyldiaminopimelate/putrescine aminotransferase
MAKAKKTKPRDQQVRWSITLIKGTPAKYLGAVFANSEAEAVKEAVKEFKIAEALRDRIVATRDDF